MEIKKAGVALVVFVVVVTNLGLRSNLIQVARLLYFDNQAVESPTCKSYVKIRLKAGFIKLRSKVGGDATSRGGQRTPASGRRNLGRPSKPTALVATNR